MNRTKHFGRAYVLWASLASLDHLYLINDPHINFLQARNGFNDHKEAETINCTIVKYGEAFYGLHTTLKSAVVKINIFQKKQTTLESKEHTHRTENSSSAHVFWPDQLVSAS